MCSLFSRLQRIFRRKQEQPDCACESCRYFMRVSIHQKYGRSYCQYGHDIDLSFVGTLDPKFGWNPVNKPCPDYSKGAML